MAADDDKKRFFSALMNYFDTGIDSVEGKSQQMDFDKILDNIPRTEAEKIKVDISNAANEHPIMFKVGEQVFILHKDENGNIVYNMERFRYLRMNSYWRMRMKNKYRLSSNAFEREEEADKVEPQKVFFLSVEGNATEKEYFESISANRKALGINAIVDIEVLNRRKKDTNSAPEHVVELLEEYLRLREYGRESLVNDIPKNFVEKYGIEFIQNYLKGEGEISRKQKNEFVTDLLKIGYDINYRKYLDKYHNELDEFGILIDRDMPVILRIHVLSSGYCYT